MRIGRVVIVVFLGAACGKRAEPEASAPPPPPPVVIDAAPPAPDAAPPIDAAPPPPFANDPSAEARALGAALAGADLTAMKKELDRVAARRPDDPPMDAPRFGVVDALVAWDRSGAPLRVDCDAAKTSLPLELLELSGIALAEATRADAPEAHAVARLGQTLRAPDNGALAIATGVQIARRVGVWARAHGTDADRVLAGATTEPDAIRRAARAEARCMLAAIPTLRAGLAPGSEGRKNLEGARRELGLAVDADSAEHELAALAAFVTATQAVIDHAPSDAAAIRALAARADAAAQDPSSVLVRTLGAPAVAELFATE